MKLGKIVLFVLLLGVFTHAAFGQEVLTNDSIVKMTKAHLSEQTILDLIQNSPGRYVVTASAFITLKQQGVSDEAISAMRARMARKPDASPLPALPAAPRWEIRDSKDEITGESQFEALLTEKAGRHGTFEVTATCPAIGLAFKIVYLSSVDPNPGYKMTDGNFLLRKPHVVMRLAIDGNSGTAPSTTSDFINEATLWFQRKLSEAEKKDIGTAVFGGLLSLTSLATPEDVYAAKLIKVEMPLGNGELPILEIHPQDPEFRKFASRCNAAGEESARMEQEEEDRKNAAAAEMQRQQQAAAAEQFKRRQAAIAAAGPGASSMPGGYAVLTVVARFPGPLTWGHYWLLGDDAATALSKEGIRVPGGVTPNDVMRSACERNEAACKRITLALDADRVAKVYADAGGKGTFPGVLPGTYCLMISALCNSRLLLWNQMVELKAGANSSVLTNTMQQR